MTFNYMMHDLMFLNSPIIITICKIDKANLRIIEIPYFEEPNSQKK